MSFYEKYVELCARHGVTPSRAAEDMGFCKSMVTKWKQRKANPSDLTKWTVAQYFGVSPCHFEEQPSLSAGQDLRRLLGKCYEEREQELKAFEELKNRISQLERENEMLYKLLDLLQGK